MRGVEGPDHITVPFGPIDACVIALDAEAKSAPTNITGEPVLKRWARSTDSESGGLDMQVYNWCAP